MELIIIILYIQKILYTPILWKLQPLLLHLYAIGVVIVIDVIPIPTLFAIATNDIPSASHSISILPICCNFHHDDVHGENEMRNDYYLNKNCMISSSSSKSQSVMKTWNVPFSLLHDGNTNRNENQSQIFSLETTLGLSCSIGDDDDDTEKIQVFQPLLLDSLSEINVGHNGKHDGIHFLSDGRLEFKNMYYERKEYCIERISKNQIDVNICKKDCSTGGTKGRRNEEKNDEDDGNTIIKGITSVCLPKCCSPGQIYNHLLECQRSNEIIKNSESINESNDLWRPILFMNPTQQISQKEQQLIKIHYMQPKIKCEQFYMYNSYKQETTSTSKETKLFYFYGQYLRFHVLIDGRITFRDHTRTWKYLSKDEFCIDGLVDESIDSANTSSRNTITVIHTCGLNSNIGRREDFEIYPILMIISSIFILLTITVYILLWKKHEHIHGWTTMSQSVSMFLFFIFLPFASLLTKYQQYPFKTYLCIGVGILSHYFLLTTFLWLTLISFDLWYTFRSITPRTSRSKGMTRFVLYSIIGWGIPLLMVITSFILDIIYKEDEESEIPLPEYGETSCYVASYSQLYYVYIPVAILMTINLLLFFYTTHKLYKYKKSTKIATRHMKNKQHSFELFAKLFFVMGISWIFEVISFAVSGGDLTWYWFVFDIINIATPISIFFIFVVKWDILYELEQKYPTLKPWIIPFVYILQFLRCKRPDHIIEEFTSLKTNETSLSKSSRTQIEKH